MKNTRLLFLVASKVNMHILFPIALSGKQLGMEIRFFLQKMPSDNDPYLYKERINKLCLKHGFDVHDVKDINTYSGILFMVEGGYGFAANAPFRAGQLRISLTQNTDYRIQYSGYHDYVDHIIFPSRYHAGLYDHISKKNLYLGAPKYDIKLDKKVILDKYILPMDSKYIIFFFPKNKLYKSIGEPGKRRIKDIYRIMRSIPGYRVITKSRGMSRVNDAYFKIDKYVEDDNLYPLESIELLHIADLAVFFSSTANEECIMTETPYLKFILDNSYDIRAISGKKTKFPLQLRKINRFDEMDNKLYSSVLLITFTDTKIKTEVKRIMQDTDERKKAFEETRNKILPNQNKTARRIIDTCLVMHKKKNEITTTNIIEEKIEVVPPPPDMVKKEPEPPPTKKQIEDARKKMKKRLEIMKFKRM